MRDFAISLILLLLSSLISGCLSGEEPPPLYEGDEPGECSDGADNDQDGLFDCDDPNCAGADVCVKPTSDDDNSDLQNQTNNDGIILGPIELTNEMIDDGVLDNNDCAVVILTTDWDGPSRLLLARMAAFDNSNSIFELYVANLQNSQGDDILPSLKQFRGGVLMPGSIPSIAIISLDEQILTNWELIQGDLLVDIVCTSEQRDSISEAFTFEDLSPTPEDLYYTRITSVTITPVNPHSHENPICSAQWESNEHDDEDLTILYSWNLLWNESAALQGMDPDAIWFSNLSESGIFDRNDTDWRTNPNNGEPVTNVEIANQSISGKELLCTAYLVTQALASGISEVDYQDAAAGMLDSDHSYPVRFTCDDGNCIPQYFRPETRNELKIAVDEWIADKYGANSTYGNISTWDTSLITDMSKLFYDNQTFNDDISKWDVSSVTTMEKMFKFAQTFNQDISGWDVSNVVYMNEMFYFATDFNQNIGYWDVSSVTDMEGMFFAATDFNQNLAGWDVSKVTDTNGMFYAATTFNGDISQWDTSNVTKINSMFYGASSFNQDISGWDVSNVNDWYGMNSMFHGAESFDQDISGWDVSNVNNMYGMFYNARTFNQDLSSWNVLGSINMNEMFEGADELSDENRCVIHNSFSSSDYWTYDWYEYCSKAQING
tara:strand:- start:474 stop:2459 length:1986 start_codon:yes stop_codon:yes gene_type:complete